MVRAAQDGDSHARKESVMHSLRQFLQPFRKSLFLRPDSPESRRIRRLAAMRAAAASVRAAWSPLPAPAYARVGLRPSRPS